jgi:hypothetical protein
MSSAMWCEVCFSLGYHKAGCPEDDQDDEDDDGPDELDAAEYRREKAIDDALEEKSAVKLDSVQRPRTL